MTTKIGPLPATSMPFAARVTAPVLFAALLPWTAQANLAHVPGSASQPSSSSDQARGIQIPRRVSTEFPSELYDKTTPASKRQELFVNTLLPLVLRENEILMKQRQQMLGLFRSLRQGRTLRAEDASWLRQLAVEYRVKGDVLTDPKARRDLASRVDIIPPALALAQAAHETGWGTSRAARKDRDLFGMTGAISEASKRQRKDRKHAKRASPRFLDLADSVHSYMRNLNRHNAYRKMRQIRAEMRTDGDVPRGGPLADGLLAYSEQGQGYIRKVKHMIRQSGFAGYDLAALAPAPGGENSIAALRLKDSVAALDWKEP